MSPEFQEQLQRDLAKALDVELESYMIASLDGGKTATLCETPSTRYLSDNLRIKPSDVVAFVAKHERYTLHEWNCLPGWTMSLGDAEYVIEAMRERGYSFDLWIGSSGAQASFHRKSADSPATSIAHGSSTAVAICEAALDALRQTADMSATTP